MSCTENMPCMSYFWLTALFGLSIDNVCRLNPPCWDSVHEIKLQIVVHIKHNYLIILDITL